jgi:2-alkyl-3-oxoalkanoate reductase
MRVFVAGATEALGRHLIPGLVAAGHQVTGTTTPGKVGQLREVARSRWWSTGWIVRR